MCDWHAKLQIVAAGLAITTLAPIIAHVLPDGDKVVAVAASRTSSGES